MRAAARARRRAHDLHDDAQRAGGRDGGVIRRGIVARITGHQDSGTGGARHCDGSELKLVCVGTTSVPSAPSTSSSAPTRACAPPHTQPSADSEECTSSTPPGRTPSRMRSSASEARVTGAGVVRDRALLAVHPAAAMYRAVRRSQKRSGVERDFLNPVRPG